MTALFIVLMRTMQLIKIVKSNLAAMHKQIKTDLFNLSFIDICPFYSFIYTSSIHIEQVSKQGMHLI